MRSRSTVRADRQGSTRARAETAAYAQVGQDVGAKRMLLRMLAGHHLDRVVGAISKALLASLAAIRIHERGGRPLSLARPHEPRQQEKQAGQKADRGEPPGRGALGRRHGHGRDHHRNAWIREAVEGLVIEAPSMDLACDRGLDGIERVSPQQGDQAHPPGPVLSYVHEAVPPEVGR